MAESKAVGAAELGWLSETIGSGLKRLFKEGERSKLLHLFEGRSRVLEMIARSAPLGTILDELTRVMEEQVDAMACSVLLLSEDRKHLRHGAAPSLPDSYWRAIDGGAVGPRASSCGRAAFLKRPVIVTDIAQDALWADDKDLALEVGLKACWSTPIVSERGEVLGTFAVYHRQPLAPSPIHLGLIDLATNLAQIAIERDTAERDRERLWDAKRFADQYRIVLEATGDAVWEWDLEDSAIHWHHNELPTLGYGAGNTESTLDWWTERIHPDEVKRVRNSVKLAVDSGKPLWEAEYRFRRSNGTYADVFARGLIVRDDTGKAVRLVGSLQDITQRKYHQHEAEQFAERIQSATTAAAVGTWRLDVNTRVFLADASLNRLMGGKEEETVQWFNEVMRFVHPEDRPRVVQAVEESITTGRPYESDHRVVLTDSGIRWIRSRGRVLYDRNGCAQFLTGAVTDITELKRHEQEMAILADASRLLVESLDFEQTLSSMSRMAVPSFSDVVLVHLKDPQTGELRLAVAHAANPELLSILREMLRSGTFRVAALSRRVVQTAHAELIPRLTPEWLRKEDVDEKVAALIRRFHVSSTIHVPIVLANRPFGVMVFAASGSRIFDARDLAFAEELGRRASHAVHNAQLFQTAKSDRERAEMAGALRERLVAIVGHDLRNPLSAISLAAEILSQSGLAAREMGFVNRIQVSANRMTRMIAQILDFARIRAGMSFEFKMTSVDLHQICTAVVDELRMSKPEQRIELNVEGNGDVMCDADRIAEALSNIIGNALQHSTRDPISVTVRDEATAAVAVVVHNFGSPIPDSSQASIFEAFHREAPAGDDRSLGLGLFIASEITRAHGGSIAVRSPDREGTTFTILLPRRPAIADAESFPAQAS